TRCSDDKIIAVSSGTEQSCYRNSSFFDDDEKLDTKRSKETSTQSQTSGGGTLITTISFITCPKCCFSCQSSLTWGHKPSPIVGQVRCYTSALFLAAGMVSTFLSDHCYTGLESGWQTVDRVLAPMALTSNQIVASPGHLCPFSLLLAIFGKSFFEKRHMQVHVSARKREVLQSGLFTMYKQSTKQQKNLNKTNGK
ncbi:hypothetical protein HJC23_013674, partial [Cyclotella cryptica]